MGLTRSFASLVLLHVPLSLRQGPYLQNLDMLASVSKTRHAAWLACQAHESLHEHSPETAGC